MWSLGPEDQMTHQERWEWFLAHFTKDMYKGLYSEAYSILRDKEETIDVIADMMEKAAIRSWQLRDKQKLFQWMYTIVRHEANLRRRKRAKGMEQIKLGVRDMVGIFEKAPDLEDYIISREEKQWLRSAINELESPAKEILEYRRTTDMSLREIAKKMNMNHNTVRSIYRRTVMKLRDGLEAMNNEEK